MLYTLKMTLSGSESPPGHCPWTPGRWRCASVTSLTPLAIIIHNYFPPLRLGWLQPCRGPLHNNLHLKSCYLKFNSNHKCQLLTVAGNPCLISNINFMQRGSGVLITVPDPPIDWFTIFKFMDVFPSRPCPFFTSGKLSDCQEQPLFKSYAHKFEDMIVNWYIEMNFYCINLQMTISHSNFT